MEDSNVELICSRIADGPEGPVGFVGKCIKCQCAVAISPASYQAAKGYPGKILATCLPCFLLKRAGTAIQIEPPTPGQLEEIRQVLRRK